MGPIYTTLLLEPVFSPLTLMLIETLTRILPRNV